MTVTDTKPAKHVTAMGLGIRTEVDCPAFTPAAPDTGVDLTITLAPAEPHVAGELLLDFEEGRHRLAWPDIAAFDIHGPDHITATPQQGLPENMLELPLIGPVIALLMHTRGDIVLHASAVDVNGGAVILLGDKGAGKSTTAAALISAGHRLLSDDVVVIRTDAGGLHLVEPAFAQMKLSESASAALLLDDTVIRTIDRAGSTNDKRVHGMRKAMGARAVPLAAVCVLDRGETMAFDLLPGADAIAQLMRFSYAVRFGPAALGGRHGAAHFCKRAQLADAVGVGHLTVARGLHRLDETVAFIENRVAGQKARAG